MKRYYTIDIEVMKAHDISANEWILLENVNFLELKSGWCFATKKELAKHIGISDRAIYIIIQNLVAKKLLRKDKNHHLKTTSKWIEIQSVKQYAKSAESAKSALQKVQTESAKSADGSMQKVQTYPIKEENEERKEERKEKKEKKIYPEILTEWIAYRREIKKPIKEATVRKLLNQYEKDKNLFILKVNHSIENGYQGLFAPKDKPATNKSKTTETIDRYFEMQKPQEVIDARIN